MTRQFCVYGTKLRQTHFKRKAHVKILLARIIIEKLDGKNKKLDSFSVKFFCLRYYTGVPYSIRADLQRDSIYICYWVWVSALRATPVPWAELRSGVQ
jgi:hypothetical protein